MNLSKHSGPEYQATTRSIIENTGIPDFAHEPLHFHTVGTGKTCTEAGHAMQLAAEHRKTKAPDFAKGTGKTCAKVATAEYIMDNIYGQDHTKTSTPETPGLSNKYRMYKFLQSQGVPDSLLPTPGGNDLDEMWEEMWRKMSTRHPTSVGFVDQNANYIDRDNYTSPSTSTSSSMNDYLNAEFQRSPANVVVNSEELQHRYRDETMRYNTAPVWTVGDYESDDSDSDTDEEHESVIFAREDQKPYPAETPHYLSNEVLSTDVPSVPVYSTKGMLQKVPCPICEESHELGAMVSTDCTHKYCRPCSVQCVRTSIKDGKHQVSCPHPGCTTLYSRHMLQTFISPWDLHKLDLLSMRNSLKSDPNLYSCQDGECQGFAIVSQPVTQFICPVSTCRRSYCILCNDPWHPKRKCIRPLMAVDSQTAGLLEGYKPCPGCRNMVFKTGGCNHMDCKCGVEWCWACGMDMGKGSNKVSNHYTKDSNGKSKCSAGATMMGYEDDTDSDEEEDDDFEAAQLTPQFLPSSPPTSSSVYDLMSLEMEQFIDAIARNVAKREESVGSNVLHTEMDSSSWYEVVNTETGQVTRQIPKPLEK